MIKIYRIMNYSYTPKKGDFIKLSNGDIAIYERIINSRIYCYASLDKDGWLCCYCRYMKAEKYSLIKATTDEKNRLLEALKYRSLAWNENKMSLSELRIYISGAIAHLDLNERKEAFKNAEATLGEMGYFPIDPFNNGLPENASWREHMKADIGLLLSCSIIYMLKGWELSKGCKLELDVATSCGLDVIFEK